MSEYMDIVDCLRSAASGYKGVTIIKSLTEEITYTYSEILRRAEVLGTYLLEKGVKKGEFVLIRCSDMTNIMFAFWTCAVRGSIAVPVVYNVNEGIKKEFVENLGNASIITDISCEHSEWFNNVIDISDFDWNYEADTKKLKGIAFSPDDILYVQYSSGTTGLSKGIPIKKKNVYTNLKDEIKCFEVNSDDIVLNWEPLTHSGGLVIFHLMSVIVGIHQYLMQETLYVKNPLFWMNMIDKYRVTLTGSVPFALRHFMNFYYNSNQKFSWDLSCLKVMTLGAEHVGITLFDEFMDEMAQYKINKGVVIPTYGLTEATCLLGYGINVGKLDTYMTERKELEYGERVVKGVKNNLIPEYILYKRLSESIDIRITNEKNNELPNGTIGKLWIKGTAVIDGYLRKNEIVLDEHFDNGWFDTGDLGCLVHERELAIMGRAKEIVISGGVNYECASLEKAIQSVQEPEFVRESVVCNMLGKDEIEQIGVFSVCDVKENSKEFWNKFLIHRDVVRTKVHEDFGVVISNVIPIEEIPRSGSGKIRRIDLGMNYSNGVFDERVGTMEQYLRNQRKIKGRPDVKKVITDIIYELLNIELKNYQMTFQEYGIVSLNIVELVNKCNEKLGIDMKASDVFNYPAIVDFISYASTLMQSDYKDMTDENFVNQDKENAKEDIVIVGMSCRFPNGANNSDAYWENLVDCIDGITEVPEKRWDKDKYYSADKNDPGKMYCKLGGFLDCPIDEFDAKFFNISPKEAVEIDPHSRMLLELTYEAFENGGMDITQYSGTNTGVYVGVSSDDYSLATVSSGDLERIDSYSLTGVCKSTVCGRISYVFGFEGGCFSVNTACSSALTALHLACISLKNKDVDNAVVGAANLMISPSVSIAFSKLKATSSNGHCRSFDADADGYARGDGAGVLVLKRLSDARKNHDHILGIVRATGINQDGKSNGLTAPNGESQRKLIVNTLNKFAIDPNSVGYIEAHGTGTPLGDPIEVNALIESYCSKRSDDNPLLLGSVKSNIGHLEAASGMASIIKVLLSFQHKMIPANLNFVKPNPQIKWEGAPIQVVASNKEWNSNGAPRRAGIDSFGFGGSNAHVILEEYCEEIVEQNTDKLNDAMLLKISAKDEASTGKLAEKYLNKLVKISDKGMVDFLNTANAGRADYNNRVVITGENKNDLVQGLRGYVQGDTVPGAHSSKNYPTKKNKICFMFTGQGSQYVNMGRQLYDTNLCFKNKLDECDSLFKHYILNSIVNMLYSEDAQDEIVNNTANAQPLIFSIEYVLAEMWEAFGIKPSMVIGHSIGEYAAAVTAGIMSLKTAVVLVAARGRLMGSMNGNSTMVTVFADEKVTESLIIDAENTVIAVYNAKENCVISGDRNEIEEICEKASVKGIGTRELKVSHAFHSPIMTPAAESFRTIIESESFYSANIEFISTVYARSLEENEILDAEYWANQICAQVKFYQSMNQISDVEDIMFVEVGATNTLTSLCKLIFDDKASYVATMNRKIGNLTQLNTAIATMYVNGFGIDWNKVGYNECKKWTRSSELPNYPFHRKSYWQELMYDRKVDVIEENVNSLLGQRIETVCLDDTVIFQKIYQSDRPLFMKEHVIFNTVIAPCASYVSILISTMKEICNPKCISICDMELHEPLIVNDDEKKIVQVCISHAHSKKCEYKIASKLANDREDQWIIHSQGLIIVDYTNYQQSNETVNVQEWDNLGYDEISSDENEHSVYAAMTRAGFNLGDGFRRVRKTRCKDHEGYCVVDSHMSLNLDEDYIIYPGVIDSVFHTMLCIILSDGFKFGERRDITMIPYFVKRISFNYRDFDKLWIHSDSVVENESFIGGSNAYNEKNQLIINIEHMITRLTNENVLITSHRLNDKLYYHYEWKKDADISIINRDINDIYAILDDENDLMEIRNIWKKQCKNVTFISGAAFDDQLDNMLNSIAKENKETIVVYGLGRKHSGIKVKEDFLKKLTDLTKGIIARSIENVCGVRILTHNACTFRNKDININQSMSWGFSKTMGMEVEKAFLGIVDTDDMGGYRDKNQLASLILFAKPFEMCIRGNEVFISRVIKHSDYTKTLKRVIEPIRLSEDETYVIAGGTGTVGVNFIEALVESGAKNIAVLSRKEPKAEVREKIENICADGINVSFIQADICNKEQLKKAVSEIENSMPKIKGIINSTGVIRDKLISDLTWDDYKFVLDPKVTGNVNLYDCVSSQKLRFFIMTSSITSIIGNMGQSNYAAANCFMNAFAEYLYQAGQNGFVFCWGPWSNGGMATDEITLKSMEVMGIGSFSSEEGKAVIVDFFKKPFKELIVAKINWNQFVQNVSGMAAKSLLENLVHIEEKNEEQKTFIKLDYSNMTKAELSDELKVQLQAICMKVMGYANPDSVDFDTSFRELGADSLMMFSIRSELNKLLDEDISVSVLYSYETINKLDDYLLDEVICFTEENKETEEEEKSTDQLFSELVDLVD